MAAADPGPVVDLLLIRSEPPCARCRKAEAVLNEIAAAAGGAVRVREIATSDPEAARYGAVVTPMVIVNGKVACAGLPPVRSGLERLIQACRRADPARPS